MTDEMPPDRALDSERSDRTEASLLLELAQHQTTLVEADSGLMEMRCAHCRVLLPCPRRVALEAQLAHPAGDQPIRDLRSPQAAAPTRIGTAGGSDDVDQLTIELARSLAGPLETILDWATFVEKERGLDAKETALLRMLIGFEIQTTFAPGDAYRFDR